MLEDQFMRRVLSWLVIASALAGHACTGDPPSIARDPTDHVGAELYVTNILTSQLRLFPRTYYETRAENRYWFLLPGGRVYFGLPTGEWDRLDFEEAQRKLPGWCGRYEVSGDEISFNYRGWRVALKKGQEWVAIPGRINPHQVSPTTVFRRVARCDGLRLKGTFESVNGIILGDGRISRGSVASVRAITFGKDSRFTSGGQYGMQAETRSTMVSGRSEDRGSGTYRIEGNVLVLTYDGAQGRRVEKFAFFRFPSEEEQVIVIDGINFLRR
jgi:hypothetical protein